MATKPLIFNIPVKDFDLSLISADARKVGTEEFKQAVIVYYGALYAERDMSAIIAVDNEAIRVVATPEGGMSPFEFALSLLNDRKIEEALPLLETLKAHTPDDSNILYNLGISYSELGRIA